MTGKIDIVGLGPGSADDLTIGTLDKLRAADKVYLRTAVHPVVDRLLAMDISFDSFDRYYEQAANFEEVYQRIIDSLLACCQGKIIVYAVPGHPLVAEKTVTRLLQQASERGITCTVSPGVSFLEAMYACLGVDPAQGLKILDAVGLNAGMLDSTLPCIITQVYNRIVASEVKLTLMEVYEDEQEVTVVRAAGIDGEQQIRRVPLYELDRLTWIDHLTSVYIPSAQVQRTPPYSLQPLVEVMGTLRAPGGCPWDHEQTHRSLRRYAVEEVYEVLEAAASGNADKLCDELGDLLLQIVFHARIAEEAGEFTIDDVVRVVTDKMIRRHPHVFGNVNAKTPDDVIRNWDQIKKREMGAERTSALDGVPVGLPALMRAHKLQVKAAKVGFDWTDIAGAWEKFHEEYQEFCQAWQNGTKCEQELEFGDMLFALVNVARFLQIEPETALTAVNEKFIARFTYMEQQAHSNNKKLQNLTLTELNELWEQAKTEKIGIK